MMGSSKVPEFIPRLSSAPPDQGQPQFRDPGKLNVDAIDFVPVSVPTLNPNVSEFEPGKLSATAKEFTANPPGQIPEESDDEGRVYIKDQELSNQSTFDISDFEIEPEYIYSPERILKAFEDFKTDSEFPKISPDLEAYKIRQIIPVPFRGNKGKNYKRKNTYQHKKEEVKETPEWRLQKENEEKKIIDKAKRYVEKLKLTPQEHEKIKRKVKITLNKLSPSNVERLQEQLCNLGKESYDNLHCLVSGIFEKAWAEPKYTKMYAQICKYLRSEFADFQFSEEEHTDKRTNHFRFELLYMCEEAFSKNPNDENFEGLNEEEIEYKLMMQRKKTNGNVQFIGELFNVRLIGPKIVLKCVYELLNLPDDSEEFDIETIPIDENKLEGACILLSTGASSFDHIKLKKNTDKIFELLGGIIKHRTLQNKYRFKVMNLIDERKEGWPKSKKEEPKKIEEVREEFHKEKDEVLKRHEYKK